MARDNFPQPVIYEVSGRAGYHCSYPGCTIATIGPKVGQSGIVITGKAGHICAAAAKGPRYLPSMSAAERKSINNAIWLCGQHHDIIDKNTCPYPATLLRKWKALIEAKAAKEQGTLGKATEEQVALITDLPGVKNTYQLYALVKSLTYTREAACPMESVLKTAGADHVLGLAATVACEVWDSEPDVSGLLMTMLTTNPDRWSYDKKVADKLQQLGTRSLGDQDLLKVGIVEPVAYTLAARGEESLFRTYLHRLADDLALQSADVLRVQTYYISDFARLDAFMRHASDASKRGICRANDYSRILDLLVKANPKRTSYRKKLVSLLNENIAALRSNGEAALAAKIEQMAAPFTLGLAD